MVIRKLDDRIGEMLARRVPTPGGNITRSEQPLVVMIIYAVHFCRADCQVVRELTACSMKMITRLTVFVSDTYS